ncbi:MAG: Tn7 transposase TnsA N-terminal domain-containing protein [Betaproteobacteria bacterium]|nr:Tn7 transposase TnsA N-terminal domain-containing protein [Betaproteobacteria bacterium]
MHRAAITTTRLMNWLKAGRGQGYGKDYLPWLQVTRQDHASIGQSHIVPDPFLGRQHHLLSSLERAGCVTAMAHPVVKDNREQFPIWPFPHPSPLLELYEAEGHAYPPDLPTESEGSLALARHLGIRHARFVGLQVPYIYTTDQLLTIESPGQKPFLVALSMKYWSDLRGSMPPQKPKNDKAKKARRRKFLKLRLEREYWKRLGIPWLLVTDRLIHQQACLNIEWALSGAIQRIRDDDVGLLKRFLMAWGSIEWQGRCIDEMKAMGRVLQINTDTAIRLLKLAILRALIPMDLTQPVHLQLAFPRGPAQSPTTIPAWSFLRYLGRPA